MLRNIVLLGLGISIGVSLPAEQVVSKLGYLTGSFEHELVESAERDAAAFAVDLGRPDRIKRVFTSPDLQGTSARKCIVGAGRGPLRSGEFVIGGELSGPASQDLLKRVAPKIWWSPLHHGAEMDLLIRARRVGQGGEYRFHSVTVASGSHGPSLELPEEQRDYFFPSAIEFLHSGKWLVVATSGSDWGCFILTMPSPVRR